VKEEHIGKVIALRPQLIGTGLTFRLQPLVKYFRNHQVKREDIGRMVADFPMLLRYNLAIIESKFRFFKRAMKRPLEDLVRFPRYVIVCFQIVLSQNPLLKLNSMSSLSPNHSLRTFSSLLDEVGPDLSTHNSLSLICRTLMNR